jgi:hypothetical protein
MIPVVRKRTSPRPLRLFISATDGDDAPARIEVAGTGCQVSRHASPSIGRPDACRNANGETDLGRGGKRMSRTWKSRFALALGTATLVASLSAGAVLAGEITGNGRLLEVKAQSICAFSGQEDLQWFTDDFQTERKPVPTRGDPGHAQSWGQIPKVVRDTLPAEEHPGNSCNGHTGFLAGGD